MRAVPSQQPAALSRDEARVLEALDDAAMDALVAELVRIPSISGSAAESDLLAVLAGRLERAGLDVDHWRLDLDALVAEPDHPGTEMHRDEAWGLVATTAGDSSDDGRTVVLQGHVDVVPPGDRHRWGADPFAPRSVGDRLIGRGTCDMKAGVAVNLAVLDAVLASGVRLPGRLALHFAGGEEDGGLGAYATLRRGHTGAACIITEPTGGTVITANAGSLTFTLRVAGAATHGSTRYAGVSAFEMFLPVHAGLLALERERNSDPDPLFAEYPTAYPLSIGVVRCGDWASTVPDLLVAEGRLGVALGEDPQHARASLEARVAEVCSSDPWLCANPVTVQWSGGQFASSSLPAGHGLTALVAAAHRQVLGTASRTRGAPYGSDLRFYAAAGIPTLHYGPGDMRVAHAADEYVERSELHRSARVVALSALRLMTQRGD